MSYWHSKIPALLGNPYPYTHQPKYYIYYGRQPICSVDTTSGVDANVKFGKYGVFLFIQPPTTPYLYLPREVMMGHIFDNLKGAQTINSLEQRRAVFAVKCRMSNVFNKVEVLK